MENGEIIRMWNKGFELCDFYVSLYFEQQSLFSTSLCFRLKEKNWHEGVFIRTTSLEKDTKDEV